MEHIIIYTVEHFAENDPSELAGAISRSIREWTTDGHPVLDIKYSSATDINGHVMFSALVLLGGYDEL